MAEYTVYVLWHHQSRSCVVLFSKQQLDIHKMTRAQNLIRRHDMRSWTNACYWYIPVKVYSWSCCIEAGKYLISLCLMCSSFNFCKCPMWHGKACNLKKETGLKNQWDGTDIFVAPYLLLESHSLTSDTQLEKDSGSLTSSQPERSNSSRWTSLPNWFGKLWNLFSPAYTTC